MMIISIAKQELRSLFLSPLAWSILGVTQFILSLFYSKGIERYILVQPELKAVNRDPGVTAVIVEYLYIWAPIFMLLIIPLITMKLISGERYNKTITLLFSAPISMTEIILGKYFGIVIFIFITVSMITVMPLSILFFGGLDLGLLTSNVVGLILVLSAYASIGLFLSSLTNSPTLSAVLSFAVLIFLFLVDLLATADSPSGLFTYISLRSHQENLFRGIFNTSDISYFILLIITFVTLSIRRLDMDRLQR